jgi:putative spermidine/putrescine transport system substrate-binding protein
MTRTAFWTTASLGTLAFPGLLLAKDLTIVGWGGALGDAQQKAIIAPYIEETGTNVVEDTYSGGLSQILAQSQAGNVTWDVVDAEMIDAVRGCDEGLLVEIDPADLAPGANGEAPEDDFFDGALAECGVASYVWSNVIAYDTEAFPGEKPQTLADFFDPEKFPGRRALRKSPRANLEWALMADGVPADQVYDVLSTDEGVERALAKLEPFRDTAIWWTAGAEPPQLLVDGEVAMTTAYNGRLYNAMVVENEPVAIIWDGQIWDYGAYIIPESAPDEETAIDYLAYATSPEKLAAFAELIAYGPARRSAAALVSEEMRPNLPTSQPNFEESLRQSANFWSDYGDDLDQRFNAWLLQE